MAKIRLESLTKLFGSVVAVSEVNLECRDGEFVSLLGPSGCGKTTTLRMIAGLEPPTGGSIYFDDRPVERLAPRDRNIAMVFENYALYPHKTVFDNIAYPLSLRGMTKAQIKGKVEQVGDLLGIRQLLARFPKEISGGQKQRVAIARALVREPVAFLMDEPLSHLDAKLRAYMRAELKRLQKELGTTTLFVTHDQLEAMTMADRVAVMDHGELQQYGTPLELFREPANVFVARFIGEPAMNLVACEVTEQDGEMFLIAEGTRIRVTGELRRKVHDARPGSNMVLLGVRPQHLILHAGNGKRDDANLLRGTVYVSEPLGDEQLVRVRVGKELVQVLTDDTLDLSMDQPVQLEVAPNRLHLFDPGTERRVS